MGGGPATHACDVPSQCSFVGHVPQLSVSLHVPSLTVPQLAPCAEQLECVQATHWLIVLHTVFAPVQVPQLSVPPQPSESVPHWAPCAAHVVGVQQRLPLQTSPPGHEPHDRENPHPSPIVPHWAPCAAQLVGVQHVLLVEHSCPPAHVPQLSVSPQPSETLPHVAPRCAQLVGLQHVLLLVQTWPAEHGGQKSSQGPGMPTQSTPHASSPQSPLHGSPSRQAAEWVVPFGSLNERHSLLPSP
jgi:hypothetical protein